MFNQCSFTCRLHALPPHTSAPAFDCAHTLMTLNHQFGALLTCVCVRLLLRGGRPLSQQIQRSVRPAMLPFCIPVIPRQPQLPPHPGSEPWHVHRRGFQRGLILSVLRKKKKTALNLEKRDANLCLWLGPLVWRATPPAAVGPEVFYCELLLQQQQRGQITNSLTLTPSPLTTQGAPAPWINPSSGRCCGRAVSG